MKLPILLNEVRSCAVCSAQLPLGPRPLIQISEKAKLLIIGQAPGKAAHESGIPWKDRSGDRLREWLGIGSDVFYDASKLAIMPMGFCYPGTAASGDMPPRPECAPLWHERLRSAMPAVELTIYVGAFAIAEYLGEEHPTLTQAVRASGDLLPRRMALPHPSPRNNMWLRRNPWFAAEAIPLLQSRVTKLINS
jgi:uracil-DNA glycosylase